MQIATICYMQYYTPGARQTNDVSTLVNRDLFQC